MRYAIQDAINTLVVLCNKRAVEAGWYNDPQTGEPIDSDPNEMLGRIQTELNNANLPSAMIRICDLAAYLDMDLGGAVMEKLAEQRRHFVKDKGGETLMARLIKTNGETSDVTPEGGTTFSLKELQGFVGGYIEIVYPPDNGLMVVNEKGLLKELPINLEASVLAHHCIVGDVLVCEEGEID